MHWWGDLCQQHIVMKIASPRLPSLARRKQSPSIKSKHTSSIAFGYLAQDSIAIGLYGSNCELAFLCLMFGLVKLTL